MKFEIDRTGRLTKISMFKARYIFIYMMQIRFFFNLLQISKVCLVFEGSKSQSVSRF